MKRYKYDIYENDGTYITTWNDVVSEPKFSNSVNSGCGEMKVILARNADDFGESDDVAFNNQVIVRCFDIDTNDGVIIYNGWISGYTPILETDKEYLEVVLLGYIQELARVELLDNGEGINDDPTAGNTKLIYTEQAPEDIIEDIIDKYNDLTGVFGKINYSVDSLEATSITIDEYTFDCVTIKEAIDKVLEMCPYNWYWYIDNNNVIHLTSFSATPDHTLFVRRDIETIKPYKRIENVKNVCYVIGGDLGAGVNLLKKYEKSASITTYGRSVHFITDNRVKHASTAEKFANAILDQQDDVEVRTQVEVIDNNNDDGFGKDIESIKAGDVINILNFLSKKTFTLWGQAIWDTDKWGYDISNVTATNINIIKIEYSPNKLVMEVSSQLPFISKKVNEIRRRLDLMSNINNPDAPTA